MRPIQLLTILFLIFTAILFFQNPIAQPLDYHSFADQRTLLRVPNFWNVVSNTPFFFIGWYGLWSAYNHWSIRQTLTIKLLPIVLSLGILATSLGSGYYHWSPDNDTLVWDRLPMTLMFMALFSLVAFDFCNTKIGTITFWISIFAGILSVAYWKWSEAQGFGDLRPYILIQFFPLVALPFLFGFFPKTVTYGKLVFGTFAFYIFAKICEHFDIFIYNITQQIWSGHTIKHLLAGVALFFVVRLLDTWRLEE